MIGGQFFEEADRRNDEQDRRLAETFVKIAGELVTPGRQRAPCRQQESPTTMMDVSPVAQLPPIQIQQRLNDLNLNGESDPQHIDHAHYRMVQRHRTLADVWDEWHGIGKFADEYNGIDGRNKLFKAKWRKHLNGMLYSRTSRLIKALDDFASSQLKSVRECIAELEPLFATQKHSVANMVDYFKQQGIIGKKRSRGKQSATRGCAGAEQ